MEAITTTIPGINAIIVSRPMRELMTLVSRVAMTNASVLITGESGTGKELVASALHHGSMRAAKPWVDVSCAALPEQLMESELFGHEKGAFSGADSAKVGLFELAHGGTLFLDEVGELEPRMQVKLLRVLDGTPYYRLGGTRKVSVDVRVLAATNQPLEDMVMQGKFRGDLFHRLSQMSLTVPPLRQRLDDIVPLAEFFLRQQRPGFDLSQSAKERLLEHSWPGNIRELRNVVTKAAILADGPRIRPEHLEISTRLIAPPLSGLRALSPFAPFESPSLGRTNSRTAAGANLDRMEESMIRSVLEQTEGHQQRAATMLGISRRTLSRKLKSYGLRTENEEDCA